MNIFVYTFKGFPFKKELAIYSPFVYDKLKEDFEYFKEVLIKKNPDLIIGIAKSRNRNSTFETKAVNIFNKVKNITKGGITEYELDFPPDGYINIKPNSGTTDCYCNWTMYKISEFIQNTSTRLQFIHIKKKDITYLTKYLSSIKS